MPKKFVGPRILSQSSLAAQVDSPYKRLLRSEMLGQSQCDGFARCGTMVHAQDTVAIHAPREPLIIAFVAFSDHATRELHNAGSRLCCALAAALQESRRCGRRRGHRRSEIRCLGP